MDKESHKAVSIYTDMKEQIKKEGFNKEGIKIKKKKLYTMAYADNVALLAEDE